MTKIRYFVFISKVFKSLSLKKLINYLCIYVSH